MKKVLVIIGAALVLGACVPQHVWIRTDGQPMRSNLALSHQLEVDKAICDGESQKANLTGVSFGNLYHQIERAQSTVAVGKGCMAQRGYLLVREEEADAKLAEAQRAAIARWESSQKQ